jgi:hypothetical protein
LFMFFFGKRSIFSKVASFTKTVNADLAATIS